MANFEIEVIIVYVLREGQKSLKITIAATYFLQINSSSNWRWRSEADSAEEFADDSNAFLYFRYLTRV